MKEKNYGPSIFTGLSIGVIFTPLVWQIIMNEPYVERYFHPLSIVLTFLGVLVWTALIWKYLFEEKYDCEKMVKAAIAGWLYENVFCFFAAYLGYTSSTPLILIIMTFAMLATIAWALDVCENPKKLANAKTEDGAS